MTNPTHLHSIAQEARRRHAVEFNEAGVILIAEEAAKIALESWKEGTQPMTHQPTPDVLDIVNDAYRQLQVENNGSGAVAVRAVEIALGRHQAKPKRTQPDNPNDIANAMRACEIAGLDWNAFLDTGKRALIEAVRLGREDPIAERSTRMDQLKRLRSIADSLNIGATAELSRALGDIADEIEGSAGIRHGMKLEQEREG